MKLLFTTAALLCCSVATQASSIHFGKRQDDAQSSNGDLPLPSTFETLEHPFLPIYVSDDVNQTVPTNSWISNLFYPSANNLAPTTPDPYTLRFLDDFNANPGVSIRQATNKTYEPYPATNDVPATNYGYMINSVVVDFRISAKEWPQGSSPKQLVTSWDHLSANLKLSSPSNDSQYIEFPIVRGMPYVTATYNSLTPVFFSQNAITSVEATSSSGDSYTGDKIKVNFNDGSGTTYIIYALNGPLTLSMNGSTLTGNASYQGTIRVAKLPNANSESLLDEHSTSWATGASLQVNPGDSNGSYSITWNKAGDTSMPLLAYAYPHHLESLTNVNKSDAQLESSSKGMMTAIVGDTWSFEESQLFSTNWLPENPVPSASKLDEIIGQLQQDVAMNYTNATQRGDNYFSGKGLQKLAMIALILNDGSTQLNNSDLANTSLSKLEDAFSVYLDNKQQNQFAYDKIYKGVISKVGLPTSMGGTGDKDAEYGSSYYNDHHYHYGYFVVTAAVIRQLDPSWRTSDLEQWTEALIKDVNSPNEDDTVFAPYRMWDWFAGHTWAGGIKVDGAIDGRDQESVPESVNFYWGMRLWGLATNNTQMSNLASLQLTIAQRSTYQYFWMLDSNTNRPAGMINNKVVGIFFEQKLDYTTYFGRYIEYIHGIQQLPMTPALIDLRTDEFVKEEWEQNIAPIANGVTSTWAGVIYLNYAIIDPNDAYEKLKTVPIDDGQTVSYSLYLAATRPGMN